VIGGIADNNVTAGVHSATIGGGGRFSVGNPATANRVTDDQGTIGGGANNQAGDGDATPTDTTRATVGGGGSNTASGPRATVGGGGSNTASGSDATVGGGGSNTASASNAAVGGGLLNTASDSSATVGGGAFNTATGGLRATVGGGFSNTASETSATVAGGDSNSASGLDATVPGGDSNSAAGSRSFAAGRRAKANHDGAFVWGDSTNADIASTASNQFIARATPGFFLTSNSVVPEDQGLINTSAGADGAGQNGAFLSDGGAWTSVSDENRKDEFAAIDPSEVLAKIADMPVRTWAYEAEPGVRHNGPTAQDFRAAFGLGADDKHIASVDADGVALAAIKGLERELQAERRLRLEQDREVAQLQARVGALERTSSASGR